MQTPQYNTLEEIELRKDELKAQLSDNSDKVGTLWRSLWVPQQANSKGELIGNLINNSITAIDAFILARKLMKTYGWLFGRKKRR
ncbi:MAG: hypothetical protein K6F43_05470 [Prevotella sp.]|jgi:hypothetical protein|nr:hypothetical protein [Prevotella sp.]